METVNREKKRKSLKFQFNELKKASKTSSNFVHTTTCMKNDACSALSNLENVVKE